ncbi:MAG: hypothetical protein PHR77_00030 [Kiritimatiellae bacterium]|nr:hypothetical protein [Kiritimatiellia bacterium]MDD5519241.1 hypothetical protein [Kiritimatiellia bacterium]
MKKKITITILLSLIMLSVCSLIQFSAVAEEKENRENILLQRLKACPYKIVYETWRGNNWELYMINADGSNPVNLTSTPDLNEMVPHMSPDGTKICFVAEEGTGAAKVRNVYYMNRDGTGRVKVGENGREPFWSHDGKSIGYLQGTQVQYNESGADKKNLFFYNIETRQSVRHPDVEITGKQVVIGGLLNACVSPNGKWIISSVMGGMGFGHNIMGIETCGTRLINLRQSGKLEDKEVWQCRPDVSPDGQHIAWSKEIHGKDGQFMFVEIGDVDFSQVEPAIKNFRTVVTVQLPLQVYQVDWSPDGKYIAFAQGGQGTRMEPAGYVVGQKARGWNLQIVDPANPGVVVQITQDGMSNKEPDWVPVKQEVLTK